MRKKKIIIILSSTLIGLISAAIIVYLFLIMIFKVDLSQSYRKIENVNQIVFMENNEAYCRCFWGLKRMITQETLETEEKVSVSWLDDSHMYRNMIYTVSASGQLVAYYDYADNEIVLCDADGAVIESFEVNHTVEQIVFSPDEQYILYQEIKYGYHGGFSSDEEYCYYCVAAIATKDVVTIYRGYREWYGLTWQAD